MSDKSILGSIVFLAFSVAAMRGCADEAGAYTSVADDGRYKPESVKIDGHKWFGCGVGDFFHTEFHAKTVQDKPAHGVVCAGLFTKATTIHTFNP
jgi:hypothetical protein